MNNLIKYFFLFLFISCLEKQNFNQNINPEKLNEEFILFQDPKLSINTKYKWYLLTDINLELELLGTSIIQNNNIMISILSNDLNNELIIISFNSDGTINKKYAKNGILEIKRMKDIGKIEALAFQNDGKIVLAGNFRKIGREKYFLARINIDGSLDYSFGEKGIIKYENENQYNIIDNIIAIKSILIKKPDNKIFLSGYILKNDNYSIFLECYNTDGTRDASFGNNGISIIDIGKNQIIPVKIIIQKDNKIIIGGRFWNGLNYDIILLRFYDNGKLDEKYGLSGKVITDIKGDDDYLYFIETQENGKIVVAGTSYLGLNWNFILLRYKYDGNLDDDFGCSGIIKTDFERKNAKAYSLYIDRNNKICNSQDNI